MKIKQPEPFLFEMGKRAVLLLHGFTGNSADVRMLGRFLEKHDYTSYAPIYRGHGLKPEAIVDFTAVDWWNDAKKAYEHLQRLGYTEIVTIGLSMGGSFALKLGAYYDVKAIVSMCTPMTEDRKGSLQKAFKFTAKQYKQFEGKERKQIKTEVDQLMERTDQLFFDINHYIEDTANELSKITAPTFIIQARKDVIVNPESVAIIEDGISSERKLVKWYENSGHVITVDKEKDQLHEDILQFLNSLEWEQ